MPFEILYHPDCLKEIRKLDASVQKRIKNAIENRLQESPAEYGKPLRYSAKSLWSLRIGDWRVIYKIMEDRVWILKVGHRREVYNPF